MSHLPNELVIIILQELVNHKEKTSFNYMNSLRRVCKNWDKLIDDILAQPIKSMLESKLLIEYDCNSLSIRGAQITYDSLSSTFNIFINNGNNDKLKLDISDIPHSQNLKQQGPIRVKFHYENGSDLILFDFGTLYISREGNDIHSEVEWNFGDCTCAYERDNNFPDSYAIQIRNMAISLKKASVILDLLNGIKGKHEHIVQRSVYGDYGVYYL